MDLGSWLFNTLEDFQIHDGTQQVSGSLVNFCSDPLSLTPFLAQNPSFCRLQLTFSFIFVAQVKLIFISELADSARILCFQLKN